MSKRAGFTFRRIVSAAALLSMGVAGGCSDEIPSGTMAADSAPVDSRVVVPGHSASPDPLHSSIMLATDSARPPSVNVFGELDNASRAAPAPRGNGGFQQHTFLEEGFDSDVSLDPTGKWMVFTSTRDSDHPNIYLQKVDGLSVIQLTSDEADYANPTFSPDGKHIAFASTRGGNWDIYVMDADGKNVSQITNDLMQHVHPSFSPDGNRLVYSCLGGRSNQWELWTVDLTTSEKRMIGFGLFPSWCPDKTVDRIAYQKARQRGSRWFSLWTLDLVDGEARQVTEVAASSNAAIVSPSWSPDGKMLAFTTIAQPAQSGTVKAAGQQDIWTISADGSNRHRLTDGVGLNLGPCWARDDRVFFISDRSGAECVWSVKPDDIGSGDSKLAGKPEGSDTPGTDAVGSVAE